MSNYTMEDLKNIKKAIANGTLEVEFSDRKVRYRSLDELMKIKKLIEIELGIIKREGLRMRPMRFSKDL